MVPAATPGRPVGVYQPRRPQASPLFRLVQDHFQRLQTVYDERFAPIYGEWRPVVGEVADKFLACARNPGALDRLTYDAQGERVVYRSDNSEGPTAGAETVEPLEFLARVHQRMLTHIPDKGQVLTRYYGWYANRSRGRRRQMAARRAEALGAEVPPVPVVPARSLALPEARRRWAELWRQIFEVDPLTCPHCGGAMRILAFVTQAAVIAPILTHLRTRALVPPPSSAARSPPARAGQP